MPGSKVGDSARVKGPTTNRVRRHEAGAEAPVGNFAPTAIVPAPPPAPTRPPRSLGDFSRAPLEEVAAAVGRHFATSPNEEWRRGRDVREFLQRIAPFPGATWQERWEASGLNELNRPVGDLAGDDTKLRYRLFSGAGHAFAIRLIRPTLHSFHANRFSVYTRWFRSVASDPLLEDFCLRVGQLPVSEPRRTRTMRDICCALTVFGIDLDGLTPEALLHYAVECRKHGLSGETLRSGTFAGTLAWPVLHDMGQFPASAPRTLRAAVTRGQLPVEEAVDRHKLDNPAVRDLLVDYITRRSASLDYSTQRQLTHLLAKVFWKTIEEINPEQKDLRLSEELFTKWKERLVTLPSGKPRLDVDGPLMAVRALYLDLHTWAVAEPEHWATWVAPCPVSDADLRWFHLRRRRLQERMANRTRERQPLLPILSKHVNDTWSRLRALLDAAESVAPGEEFQFDGATWLRTSSRDDINHNRPPVRVINRGSGELVRLSFEENQAFWQWAVVETLRLAGLRAEELVELSHLSVRQYQRPNGEVVALLVITPSKSDRERVIPMSAELFHVIAQIIRRHRKLHGTVPVCARYDLHEKVWSDELPYLFQTLHGGTQRCMSSTTAWRMIRRACQELEATHPEFVGVKFAPHDFRRLFATELINNGLPIHIGAALLGHLDIRTTRGYVAVFDEDVISHYQQFLARRRAERPEEEYRRPSPEEWTEFEEHFDKRRVELGSCGRPYGTPCAHEHACIRCPMLSINPKMIPRLDELEQDLLARRDRATAEGWQGEIEGLDLTLTFLRSKREQARRFQRQGPVSLGLPMIPHQEPQVTDV
ncbi:phage integrase family protein [Streptomyces sp. 1114.5]|uniref:tyrosine-type recombinase/integrase n=1 Tax=Streptomyces sp. 1114.5 TaxID=1938830 RepID=UPI000F0EE8B7|nr:site-specific integrase [Streptomyces sp. 1114.5]RKT09865.1 phage integrase family protein [Streptomyces sp. 1114.5]